MPGGVAIAEGLLVAVGSTGGIRVGVLLDVGTKLGVAGGDCVAGSDFGVGIVDVATIVLTRDIASLVGVGVGVSDAVSQPTRKKAILNISILGKRESLPSFILYHPVING